MNQVLRIFRKDLHHHWKSCVVYLLLLVGYAYHAIYAWRASGVPAYTAGFDPLSLPHEFLRVLVVLIPAAWALMVSGVVHDESLAGTRQFWVTRPYDWRQLLAAKVLFVLVTVNLPMLVLGIFLLAKAGFPPLPHFYGLLWMQVMILIVPLLPFAGMATITSKTSQFVLYWFAIPLYYSGLAALAAQIPSSHNGLSISGLSLIVPTAACLVVILIQYARRRTVLSLAIFGALAVLIAIITVVPSPREDTIPSTYRALAAGETAPLQLQLIPIEITPPPDQTRGSDYVQMQIPFAVSGVAPDSIIQLNELMVSIDGPNGLRWNSDLQGSRVEIYPETKETKLVFGVKRDLLDRIGSGRVNLRITVAFTVFRDTNRRSVVASDGEFTVPGFGICSTSVTPYLASGISCRSPLRRPSALLTYDLSESTCKSSSGAFPALQGELARGWEMGWGFGPASYGISSVEAFLLNFQPTNSDSSYEGHGVCPGTPITVSSPQLRYTARTELALDQLPFANYRFDYAIERISVHGRQ